MRRFKRFFLCYATAVSMSVYINHFFPTEQIIWLNLLLALTGLLLLRFDKD